MRDERGAGIANDEDGIVIRGDWGLEREDVAALLLEAELSADEVDDDDADSKDMLRDKAG